MLRFVGLDAGWTLTLREGTVYTFTYNGDLASIRDRFGNALTLVREWISPSGMPNKPWGKIQRIVGPSGRWIDLTYDAQTRIVQALDHQGRVVSYTYDGSGRLVQVTDAAGGVTEYTYDTSPRMLTIKDARGIVFLTNTYDANGRVQTQTQADSTTYQFAYTVDGGGKVTQTELTNPRGDVRRATFDAAGYPLLHVMTGQYYGRDVREALEDFLRATWPSEERFDDWRSYSIVAFGDLHFCDGVTEVARTVVSRL